MLNRRSALACASVLVLLSGSACRRTVESKTETVNEQPSIALTLKVRGDLRFDIDQKVKTNFIRIRSNDKQAQSIQVLGIRPVEPIKYGKGLLLPAVAAIPYRGDGRYYVAVGGPPTSVPNISGGAAAAEAAPKSSVSMNWWADGDLETNPLQFDTQVVECKIDVSKNGIEGHAKCPKMTTKRGDKTISLELTWKAPKITPTTTTTVAATTTPGSTP